MKSCLGSLLFTSKKLRCSRFCQQFNWSSFDGRSVPLISSQSVLTGCANAIVSSESVFGGIMFWRLAQC